MKTWKQQAQIVIFALPGNKAHGDIRDSLMATVILPQSFLRFDKYKGRYAEKQTPAGSSN